ncbi:MAG: DUF2505 domain-containing protein [Propionicimonas sp.]|uniref:DUF2505 domain-containing protein n=1 Tax=Propionicimonas sp. TaxID=1955623 RepID=UPI003D0C9386
MEIHATNDFAAPVPTVFAMLTDPVFLRAVCLATDPLEHDVTVDGLRTSTRRVMPTPSVVARLAGPRMAVVDEITWEPGEVDGGRRGAAHITVEGLPAELVGVVTLRPGGSGSVLHYDGELTVNVPFLGPGLAKQAAPLLLEALEIQQRVGTEFLAR